LLRESHWS
jgi:hypothetical protein